MRKIFIVAGLLVTLLGFSSCKEGVKKVDEKVAEGLNIADATVNVNPDGQYALLGKTAKLSFPEMVAEVHYTNASQLHWETVNDKNEKHLGDENINYAQVGEHLYFLNWIEQDGFTVSQIIDTKAGTVKAFWSFNDPKSPRGHRASSFVEGKFEYVTVK